ncbi:elongator complex protein 4 [Enteropsectra breve]|nr:elongator complex protein 4 [Enteropsectra breve]
MSGFIKSTKKYGDSSKKSIKTGINELDSLINVFPGSLNAIYEDENSFVHNTVLQIMLSEAIHNRKADVKVLAKEEKLLHYFDKAQVARTEPKEEERMIIAWRYKSLSVQKPAFEYDLAKKIPISSDSVAKSLSCLMEMLKNTKNGTFVIFSLFSPLYAVEESIAKNKDAQYSILHDLMKYAKLNGHVVFLSLPTFMIDAKCDIFMDNVVAIESLIALPGESYYYNCILELRKIGSFGSLRVNNLESFRYGIKIKSKAFTIEKIDIPPEESQGNASLPCGNSF